jgi:hypothetical protein
MDREAARQASAKQVAVYVPPRFAPVVTAFARDRSVRRGKGWGAGNIVLTVDGKIFAMLVRGRFVAKLPNQRVDQLVQSGIGEHFDAGRGRPMKEWVALKGGQPRWVELAREAHRFVGGGKP